MREPKISVCIMHSDKINFDLYGDYSLKGRKEKLKGRFSAIIENGKIVLTGGDKRFELKSGAIIESEDPEGDSFLLRDVLIGIDFHWQKKENQRFLGSLQLIIENELVGAVNIIPVEKYLTSVISSEMAATSSAELLKAHSIISRSWVLAQIEKGKLLKDKENSYKSSHIDDQEIIKWYDREDHTLYDVCADDHCQRYQGITRLYAHNAQNAVSSTSGLVLMYENKICDTRFSKSCGGVSESFENVWEPVKHGYLESIIDYKFEPEGYELDLTSEVAAKRWIKTNPHAFCNTDDQKILKQVLVDYDQKTKDFYRWKVEYSQNELSELIKKKSGIDFGDIIDMIPIERGKSGRIIKLKIVGTKKTLIIGKELEIRRTLSQSHLYSSAFIVEKSEVVDGIPGKFMLQGAGWGHGVGLCQIGAAVMGELGYTFDEILLHYFRGAEIKKYYD